jgi:hypothetical protein
MEGLEILALVAIIVVVIWLLIYLPFFAGVIEKENSSVVTLTVHDHYAFKKGDQVRYLIPEKYATLEIVEINGNEITFKRIDDGNNSS